MLFLGGKDTMNTAGVSISGVGLLLWYLGPGVCYQLV